MAKFCTQTGFTPSQFWELTYEEYVVMVEELNRRK
jgi:hypothetical protein